MKTILTRRTAGLTLNFLLQLRLWQKFALLGMIAVALAAFPMYRLFQGIERSIAQVRTEQSGLGAITAALELVRTMQDHRASASYFVLGDEKRGAAQPKDAAAVDSALTKLQAITAPLGQHNLTARVAAFEKMWTATKEDVAGRKIDQRQVTEQHIQAIATVLRLVEDLSAAYQIDLDSDPATFYIARSTLIRLPALSEALGQLRSPVVSRLQEIAAARNGPDAADAQKLEAALRNAFRPSDRARIRESLRDVQNALDHYVADQRLALQALPSLESSGSGAQIAEIQRATSRAIELVQHEILDREMPQMDPGTYLKEVSAPRELVQKAATQQQVLSDEMRRRVAEASSGRLKTLAVVLAMLTIGTLVAVLIVRNITSTVSGLQHSVERVRGGDFSALQSIESRDEVGDLGRTVNQLLQERIAAQNESEAQARKAEAANEMLNNSVISILQAVNQLSQRDLTARAPVTQDIIGTVSDSVNALADETAKVLGEVSRIASNVAHASGKVKGQADLVSRTAEDERRSVGDVIATLAQATEAMTHVASLAEQSNRSAERATEATQNALQTVNGTVQGMESIRETISETEKRIKRLGERSQEITGIVNLINTISERTHVLALNASMQAAVAGEAGRGFAVVAEEVQRLAESSRSATQQIGALVGNIQLETNETITTVNKTIGQVVAGSEQAQKAGEQMRVTQQITGELVAQVQRIASSSQAQKSAAEELLKSVEAIGHSTERTAQQIETQNQETESLMDSARRLVASVNVFKLAQA
ncbi:HAMP domain-containing protein [Ramlibacter ginsenosidimutans]|uniref:HAMP domain-containing protein n=1 Tax=Ramlibacter ginsenosidimutans TaxID=502333 RepID=A0A934WQ06_9BURK|nr:methyl-accepting chemotaxis protein [Ramlibacter ginsenosidimutans]MBK6008702.1 HAMP domain-containing protein [Ramlibacter ginsenosidimutans]